MNCRYDLQVLPRRHSRIYFDSMLEGGVDTSSEFEIDRVVKQAFLKAAALKGYCPTYYTGNIEPTGTGKRKLR